MKQGIFWDWDGVLYDSMGAIHSAVKNVFVLDGKKPPTFEEFYLTFDVPVFSYYRSQGINASDKEIEEWYFSELPKHYHKNELFEQTIETVGALKKYNVVMGIISGSPKEDIENILKKASLMQLFEFIDGKTFNKDKGILMRRKEFNLKPEDIVFIGDLPSDMRDGKKAGVRTIGFTGPIYSRDSMLFDAGADECVYEHSAFQQVVFK